MTFTVTSDNDNIIDCNKWHFNRFLVEWGASNVMGDVGDSEMEWNESFFRDCFDTTVKIVTWVSRKQKSFTRFQMITQQLIKDKKIQYGDAMLKSVETRFPSRHAVTERVMYLKVYKTLDKDELFLACLHK